MSNTNEMLLDRIEELERRLAQVEVQPKRRGNWGTYAMTFALAGVMLFALTAPSWVVAQDGDKGPQELTCKKLTIVNADGKARMILSFGEDGGFLNIMNTQGKKIASLGSEKFGGIFRLFSADEKKSLIIGSNKDGCQINVCDVDGNFRGYLGVDGAKEGYLTLKNVKDKTTLYCGEDDDGGLIRAYGHDGKERAFFGVGAKGGDGLLMLYGADGKRRHWLGSDSDATSHSIYATGGILQHEIRGGKTGSYHSMMSKDGQSIVTTIGASNDSGEGILRLNTVKGRTVAYLGSNKNNTGGLILLNTPEDSSRVVLGIDANGVGFGEGRDAENRVQRSLK